MADARAQREEGHRQDEEDERRARGDQQAARAARGGRAHPQKMYPQGEDRDASWTVTVMGYYASPAAVSCAGSCPSSGCCTSVVHVPGSAADAVSEPVLRGLDAASGCWAPDPSRSSAFT